MAEDRRSADQRLPHPSSGAMSIGMIVISKSTISQAAKQPPQQQSKSRMLDSTFLQLQHNDLNGFVRCKYPGKFCRQQRARKRNGQLHRFCEEYRSRANHNQKRWSASRLQWWETLAEFSGGLLEPRFDHQELDFTALMDQVQAHNWSSTTFPYPVQFTVAGVDNVAFSSGFDDSSVDVDGILQDLFSPAPSDTFVFEDPTWDLTQRV